jgi:hypothetical protein
LQGQQALQQLAAHVAVHPELFLENNEVAVAGMQDRLDRVAVCALLRRQSDVRMFFPPTPGQ